MVIMDILSELPEIETIEYKTKQIYAVKHSLL